jgi:hypothetical protein
MPVAQILCEGVNNSPDVRVLHKLLAGVCEVKPSYGKYGMGERIIARREVLGINSVFGILDGDFLSDWNNFSDSIRDWKGDDTLLGWRWNRKEIENYLVDPEVVTKAIQLTPEQKTNYTKALEQARDFIAVYQAARTALSANRK